MPTLYDPHDIALFFFASRKLSILTRYARQRIRRRRERTQLDRSRQRPSVAQPAGQHAGPCQIQAGRPAPHALPVQTPVQVGLPPSNSRMPSQQRALPTRLGLNKIPHVYFQSLQRRYHGAPFHGDANTGIMEASMIRMSSGVYTHKFTDTFANILFLTHTHAHMRTHSFFLSHTPILYTRMRVRIHKHK
jgi:hypothetical protein